MPIRTFREFIKLEASAGIFLFCTALLALLVDNTSWHVYYQRFFHASLGFHYGSWALEKPLLLWVNDGFMAIFFLLVGLEIKRELMEGELSSRARAILPAIAAVGGMVVPALFYIAFNRHNPAVLRGWAIPTATDIAFSLAILNLLGARIPRSLKIFLTALAIFDDLGAILIIALFYTRHISVLMLLVALLLVMLLFLMNQLNVTRVGLYLWVGLILWVCVLKSGVHATLAGILVAFAIPLRNDKQHRHSPLRDLEHQLHPWVAFGILPLFAFANAGVSFQGIQWVHLFSALPMGIAAGLFLGKQLGIWGLSFGAIRLKIAHLPRGMTPLSLYGVALLAGVGFTMSLFIGSLAFGEADIQSLALVRFGVILGSFLSGLLGYIVLRYSNSR